MKLWKVKHRKIGWVCYLDPLLPAGSIRHEMEEREMDVDAENIYDHTEPQPIIMAKDIPPGWRGGAIPWYTDKEPIPGDPNASMRKVLQYIKTGSKE